MSINIRKCLLLLLCGVILLVTSCAFGNRHVTLVYPPEKQSEGAGPKVAEAAPIPINDKSVVLIQFVDQRSDKRVIGEVRNGWGMHTADVLVENDVSDWVTQAIRFEMEKVGFKVITTNDKNNPTTDPVLSGDILTVYCVALFSYEGEVSFFANIQKDGEEILKKRYTGKGSAGLNWAASASGYCESLSQALSIAAKDLVDDLREMIQENKI